MTTMSERLAKLETAAAFVWDKWEETAVVALDGFVSELAGDRVCHE